MGNIPSSKDFKTVCKGVKSANGNQPTPLFFQFITDDIFKQLIMIDHPVEASQIQTSQDECLHSFEQNALRYVAGYVCRVWINGSLDHERRDDFALMELVGNESNDLGTAEWINLIDRWHVNDEVYELFEIMELESKKIFIIADDIAETNHRKWTFSIQMVSLVFRNGRHSSKYFVKENDWLVYYCMKIWICRLCRILQAGSKEDI